MTTAQPPVKPQMRPPAQRDDAYDYHEVFEYIQEKYGVDVNDFAGSGGHFDTWCDARGYGETDPEGKRRGSSNIWFAEYRRASDGEAKCPPYQNFTHWLADVEEMHNGADFTVNVGYHLGQNIPDYVRTILGYLRTEFGDDIPMYIEW